LVLIDRYLHVRLKKTDEDLHCLSFRRLASSHLLANRLSRRCEWLVAATQKDQSAVRWVQFGADRRREVLKITWNSLPRSTRISSSNAKCLKTKQYSIRSITNSRFQFQFPCFRPYAPDMPVERFPPRKKISSKDIHISPRIKEQFTKKPQIPSIPAKEK
jgi:hypothetical protein